MKRLKHKLRYGWYSIVAFVKGKRISQVWPRDEWGRWR